ncbi:hypothetical protein MTO96_013192 [Rhipicephalus appendiculatus]
MTRLCERTVTCRRPRSAVGGVFQREINGVRDTAAGREREPRQLRCEERCPLARRRWTHAPMAGKSEAPSRDESVEEHRGLLLPLHSIRAPVSTRYTPPPTSSLCGAIGTAPHQAAKHPPVHVFSLFFALGTKGSSGETREISLRRRKRISRRLFPPSAAKRGAAATGPDGLPSCGGRRDLARQWPDRRRFVQRSHTGPDPYRDGQPVAHNTIHPAHEACRQANAHTR